MTTSYFLAGSFDEGGVVVGLPAVGAVGCFAGSFPAAAAAGAAAAGAVAPGIILTFLTPTAPPFLPVVLVHWPLTLRPNMCL